LHTGYFNIYYCIYGFMPVLQNNQRGNSLDESVRG
jgi:hypothetical protein